MPKPMHDPSHEHPLLRQLVDGLDPADSSFAVAFVDRLLPITVASGASDVHLQPSSDGWKILLRIDGVLSLVGKLEGGGDSDPVARLMVLAGLPTYRSSQPLEGRLKWNRGQDVDSTSDASLRLGIYPTIGGPRAVIRVLRQSIDIGSLDRLGFDQHTASQITDLCQCTDGAILLTGPSGSGKTTTMYSMLHEISLQHPRRSVLTIEDPVEAVIDGISQSELDPGGGMTLASAVRSAVRQDSEVMLVSEIRDPETAEAAMQASLTGHLIFSSLHATDVASTLRRLVAFGVPPHVVGSGIRAIINQRLLRRRCSGCERESQTCPKCLGTGYHGRQAIAHCVMFDGNDPVGESLSQSLQAGLSTAAMQAAAAKAGGESLRQKAQHLVDDGTTDPAEVYRVLGAV